MHHCSVCSCGYFLTAGTRSCNCGYPHFFFKRIPFQYLQCLQTSNPFSRESCPLRRSNTNSGQRSLRNRRSARRAQVYARNLAGTGPLVRSMLEPLRTSRCTPVAAVTSELAPEPPAANTNDSGMRSRVAYVCALQRARVLKSKSGKKSSTRTLLATTQSTTRRSLSQKCPCVRRL